MKILETKRLFLREMNNDDAENLYLLNFDKDVIKYTEDPPFENIESAKHFIEK